MKGNKAIIVVWSVEESLGKEKSEISKEIVRELVDDLPVI